MKYLIFLDIDGTIIADGRIHPRTVSAIREARERGHKVLLNTGRSYGIIQKEVLDIAKPSGIVGGLGAWIYLDGKVLFSKNATREEILKAIAVSEKYKNALIIEAEEVGVCYGGAPRFGDENRVFSADEFFERFSHIRVSKFTYVNRLSAEAADELSEDFEVFNHPTYAEIGLKGCGKAQGMEYLRELLGIDRDHVIAMGDSDNDTLMLKAAGISVVMGNGLPSVKAIADFVSIDCKDGGVGYAIEKLVLEK